MPRERVRPAASSTRASRNVVATPHRGSDGLPEHEKPRFPLSARAQNDLVLLYNKNPLQPVRFHYEKAAEVITSSAAQLHELLAKHQARVNKAAKRDGPDQELQNNLAEQTQRVHDLTAQLELHMRGVVDGMHAASFTEDVLRWLRDSAGDLTHREAARSRRRRGRRDTDGDETMTDADVDNDAEADTGSPEPTPIVTQSALTGPSELFERKIIAARKQYHGMSAVARYSTSNGYVGFRRTLHDAQHPDEMAPPLPRPETWFDEDGEPVYGAGDGDVVVGAVRVPTKCPISHQEMEDPVSSKCCPHTYDKASVMALLRQSRGQVECPIAGCEAVIARGDLHSDPILIRKIRRIQQQAQAAADSSEGSSDDDAPNEEGDAEASGSPAQTNEGNEIASEASEASEARMGSEEL